MSEAIAYFNGAYVPYAQAQLSLHDAGVVWGATITDRVRTFRQQPFRLADHLKRFARSCALAKVPLEHDEATLTEIVHEVLARNVSQYPAAQEFSVLLLATPGPLAGFSPHAATGNPSLIVYALPLNPARFHPLWTHGARLRTELATLGCNPAIKHRSRLPWWIAQQKVRKVDSNAEPLFLTDEGEVLETPTANFIAVADDVLVIPPCAQILAGVSLDVVRELCDDLHIPTEERPLTVDEFEYCSEAMLVNTSYCLASVAQIDQTTIPHPGPVYRQLVHAWSRLVGVEIVPSM